ncbi:hypothetical protein JOC95_000373 [Bacillus tianshenii]|uniref:Uncharacterized protein n=1 Tax=Sutcliffiella tianshenii TaxID=1463404 RepID=A0ABS2NV61_9BACI|nr:hypothetical protein [Bacillus tianshenii]MBM7618531.1 hypothetical protein [Bacillus tianshenii]
MERSSNRTNLDRNLHKFNAIDLTDQEHHESLQAVMRGIKRKRSIKQPLFAYTLSAAAVVGLLLFTYNNYPALFYPNAEKPIETAPVEDEKEYLLQDPSKENIESFLIEQEVEIAEWSPNEEQVVFVKPMKGKENQAGPLLSWHVGENKPSEIPNQQGNTGTYFIWSPDSSKLIIRSGTSIVSSGTIIDAVRLETIGELSFVGDAVWSPDSKYISYGLMDQDVTPIVATEISGVQLSVYNLATGKTVALLPADEEVYYTPTTWEGDVLYFNEISFTTGNMMGKAIEVGVYLQEEKAVDESAAPVDFYNVFGSYDIGPVNYLSEEMDFYPLSSSNYVVGVGILADAAPMYQLYEINGARDKVTIIRKVTGGGEEVSAAVEQILQQQNWQEELAAYMLEELKPIKEPFFSYDPNITETDVDIQGGKIRLYPVTIGKDTYYFKKGQGLWAKHLASDRIIENYTEPQFVYRGYVY